VSQLFIKKHIADNYVSANPKYEKIQLGPGEGYKLETRFSGPDPDLLRELAKKATTIMHEDGGTYSIRTDWRERVKLIKPIMAESQARQAGISRDDISEALETSFSGTQVGVFREYDYLIPIVSRRPAEERLDVENLYNVQVWSRITRNHIPLRQVVSDFKTTWEDQVIQRRNKKPTIKAQAEPIVGNASVVLERIMPQINKIPLPIGYELEWGGEFENSRDAQKGLAANLPSTVFMMIFITIILFNALRQPLIIWLTVPLAIIGVSFGLLITNESFGFMPLLGFLSLIGMLIKNAIVLLDEIDMQIRGGKEKFHGIVDAAISRLRPVSMAAITTILGMVPLLPDVFFKGMAVTIMSGLAFATLLTMILVPVFYAISFRIPYEKY